MQIRCWLDLLFYYGSCFSFTATSLRSKLGLSVLLHDHNLRISSLVTCRAVRYGQKYISRFLDFFFDFDFNHDFDTNRHALSHILLVFAHLVFAHLTCLAHLVLHFSLFYYTFYSLFLFFTYIYIYIYALVWCYFYIIFILCTVHWADLIWSTFHFWLYPV